MDIIYFRLFFSIFLFQLLCFNAFANVHHDPNEVFFNVSRSLGVNATNATGAYELHTQGFRGKGTTIAVIDELFKPDVIQDFLNKDQIHPIAIRDKTVTFPDEVRHLNSNSIQAELNILSQEYTSKKSDSLYQRIDKKAEMLLKSRHLAEVEKDPHGTDVMQTAALLAPEATYLPIDLMNIPHIKIKGRECQVAKSSLADAWIRAISLAIEAKVDVINCCIGMPQSNRMEMPKTKELIAIMKKAIHQGIAIIAAVGNERNTVPDENPCEIQAFNECGRKGVIFAGGITIEQSGSEAFFPCSTPSTNELSHYLTSVMGIPLASESALFYGCSASTPVISGGFLLLRQMAGNELPTEVLIRILCNSGHRVSHTTQGTVSETYKVMNLSNAAQQLMAKKAAAEPTTAVAAPTVVVRTSPSAVQHLPTDWTWEGYLNANLGLANLFVRKGNEGKSKEEILIHHYLHWGQKGGLQYKVSDDGASAVSASINEEGCLLGEVWAEHRTQLPKNWTAQGYLNQNPTLSNMFHRPRPGGWTDADVLANHYIKWGQGSGLKYLPE